MTTILEKYPQTKLFFQKHITKEKLVPLEEINENTKGSMDMKCPECGYEWKTSISLWDIRGFCPCCGFDGTSDGKIKHKKTVERLNIRTFKQANPKAAENWRYDLNDYSPDRLKAKSNIKCHFTCENGHAFARELCKMYRKDGTPIVCPICEGIKGVICSGVNDLFTLLPAAKDFWNFDKNTVDPTTLSAQSGHDVHWRCKNGHTFQRKIQAFYLNPYCPECEKRSKSITAARPDMMEWWDFEKNTLDPNDVTPYSKENAWWKCKKCGYSWNTKISSRATVKGVCPNCDLNRASDALPAEKSFRFHKREASKLWIDEMNEGLTPDNVSWKSGKEVYLRCANNPKHIYKRKVCVIPDEAPYGCPYCQNRRRKTFPGETDFLTVCPEAKEMWDYEMNSEDPTQIFPTSDKTAYFKCKIGHSFQKQIRNFTNHPICPDCEKISKSVANFPHLVKQWDFKKNKDINIYMISALSDKKVWWRCKKCGYSWQSEISSRRASKGECPCCETRIVVVKGITDLFTLVPEAKKFYDFENNPEVNTDKLSTTNMTNVNWKCDVCGYTWKSTVSSQIITEDGKYRFKGCSGCSGTRRVNPIVSDYPKLRELYDADANEYPIEYYKNTTSEANWKCNVCGERFRADFQAMIRAYDTSSRGCLVCSRKKIRKEESFGFLFPDLMEEYAPTNTIDAYAVVPYSTKEVNWICKNDPRHTWTTSFSRRHSRYGGCPICTETEPPKVRDIRPELRLMYDNERNELSFDELNVGSHNRVWWKCEKGHSFNDRIHYMATNNIGCPYCEDRRLLRGFNSFADRKPELVKEWSEENEVSPDQVLHTIKTWTLWDCPSCGGTYGAFANERILGDGSCPYCSSDRVLPGFNSLDVQKPELVNEWSPNNKRQISEFLPSSAYRALWTCPVCNGEYTAPIRDREIGDDGCPYCAKKKALPGINTIEAIKPGLEKEWSKNNEEHWTKFPYTFKQSVLWNCSTCGGEYSASIRTREVGDDSCPYCSNRKALQGFNTIEAVKPGLEKEWSSNNKSDWSDFPYTFKQYVLWNCPTCGGEYPASIRKRDVGDDSCPYCRSKKVLPGFNSLDVVKPELIPEWSPNNEHHMNEFLPTSFYPALWNCPTCGGEYEARIRVREAGDDSCPYCAGKKILPGFNSFEAKHPDLTEQYWDYENNYILGDPDEVLINSPIRFWWLCKNNPEHRYRLTIKQFLMYLKRSKEPCLECKGRRRTRIHFMSYRKF